MVWDKASPRDWKFNDYQNDEKKMRQFLEDSKANRIIIPYRQNRAAIFDSTVYHVAENPKFREGYENRRLNLTMRFGKELRT